MDEHTLALIDQGLANLGDLADRLLQERDGDLFLVIDDLAKAVRGGDATMKDVSTFCAFAILRLKEYL